MIDTDIATQVPPPGEFIEEELEARGWSQTDLAYILGVTPQAINPIISGKRRIGTEMAKALAKAFDVPAELFSNLQAAYDLYTSAEPDPSIERRARLQDHFPVREMIKRGWIEDDGDASLLEAQMVRFFQAKSLDTIPYMTHAAKKTQYELRAIQPVQLTWLFRVRQISKEITVRNYSEKLLRTGVETLRGFLSDPAELRHVPQLLADCGVRLVLVEKLPGAKIDGVTIWLNSRSPVIGMSIRFDRIDNFWFVLRHEIEHVLNKDGQNQEIIDDLEGENSGDSENLPEEERKANAAAAEFCTPKNELVSFIQRKSPYLSERDILGFARRLQIHPGVVIGQIHRHTRDHRLLRRHLVKIQEYITPYAVADGWGDPFPLTI